MTMRIVGMCPRKRKVSVCVLDSHPDGLRFVKAGYHDVTREAIAAALSVFSGKESRRLIAVEVSRKSSSRTGTGRRNGTRPRCGPLERGQRNERPVIPTRSQASDRVGCR